MAYLSYRKGKGGKGLAPATYRSYLSAIRSAHIHAGFEVPKTSSPRIALILKSAAANATPPQPKQPIDFQLLQAIWGLVPDSFDGTTIKACLALGFFSCLRGAEYLLVSGDKGSIIIPPPKLSAVSFGNHVGTHYLVYKVPKSKTCLHGFHRFVGCSRHVLCGLCCMWTYLLARQQVATANPDSPLFMWHNGKVVTKNQLNHFIKQSVSKLGLQPNLYSTHSLRSGVVSQGSDTLPEWALSSMGGWRSTNFRSYIRNTGVHQIGLAPVLANNQ